MKYLSDYMEAAQTELFDKTNTFFAFSQKQFDEGKKENIDYVSVGAGMVCERSRVKELVEGLERIYKEGIQTDLKENGKEAIIIRELGNHECWYTGNPTDAIEKLEDYGITKKEIIKSFRENWPD